LAAAGAGDHQHRPFERGRGLVLRPVQLARVVDAVAVVGPGGRPRAKRVGLHRRGPVSGLYRAGWEAARKRPLRAPPASPPARLSDGRLTGTRSGSRTLPASPPPVRIGSPAPRPPRTDRPPGLYSAPMHRRCSSSRLAVPDLR